MLFSTKNKNIFNWEYWPSVMFYLPNLPYAFYLAIKARSLTFFTAANPCIKSSGNGTESKYITTQLIPEAFKPKSVLIQPNSNFNAVLKLIEENNISFPLIAKPDVGFRGLLVKKINNKGELESYLKKHPIAIIIQEFLNYEYECGIFYHRIPNKKYGKITSVTLKRFLSVTGNGKSTLKELILQNNRAKRYLPLLQEIHKNNFNKIPKNNEVITLNNIGNHAKGTQFINGNHLISKELEETFNKLSQSIPGWYYGRVDIKYNDFKDLENNKNFKILEINGIISEPTHIYDASKSTYFTALKTIRTHWKYLYNVSVENHKNCVPYKKIRTFAVEFLWLKNYKRKIKTYSDL